MGKLTYCTIKNAKKANIFMSIYKIVAYTEAVLLGLSTTYLIYYSNNFESFVNITYLYFDR